MANKKEIDFNSPNAQPFFFQGGDHGVLLLHGFTGSVSHMRVIGEALHQAGFTVRGINLPGHGSSYTDMKETSWQDWLQAAKVALAEMKEQCSQVSVAGLSMGGVLALLLAQQTKVTSVIPISAPMAVKNRLIALAKWAAPFMPVMHWGGNPERAKLLDQAYDFGYGSFPTKCAGDLNTLIRMARKNLFAVTCPIFVVQSHGDETITPDSAEVILSGVKSQDKSVLWLDDVPHVCTISSESANVAQAMAAFLKRIEG